MTTPAEFVRDAYGLQVASLGARFESFRNESWLVEDAHGARYVLRRHLLHIGLDRLEFQLRFQQHLRSQGLPTAEVVATLTGAPIALDTGGAPWVLFGYVDGREYDFARPAQIEEAGRRLAQFHLIGQSFREEAPTLGYQGPVRELWQRVEHDLTELDEMFAGRGLQEELSYLRQWWRETLGEWPPSRLDALPEGWTHGDYHGRNLAFNGDTLAALFDFDEVERGPFVYDVASGLHKFGRESRGSFRFRPEPVRRFVEAYHGTRALTDEERAALPLMVAMNYAPRPASFRHWRDSFGKDQAPVLRRHVSTMKTLRSEMARN